MTQKAGFSAAIAARIFSSWISASTRTFAPLKPSLRERNAICEPLSSPVTYSTFICADKASTACSNKVLLPMPGSPPISTTAPSTMPPPSTRSSSSCPVGVRAISAASISLSVATGWLRARAWKRVLRVAGPAGSAIVSSSVFQALQCGHLPSHLALVPPHSLQV